MTGYKEPFGEIVSYTHDKIGRLKTVAGSRTVENVQLNYVTDAKYRAWGAAKKVDFIGGRSETSSFNIGLQIDEYVFSVAGYSTRLQYDYSDDGKLKNSKYLDNMYLNSQSLPNFERSYEFDFLGRLKRATTGAEARGQNETNPLNRPYRMTLEYNQFDDITSQSRLHYVASFSSTFEYENARNTREGGTGNIPGWENYGVGNIDIFDADGRSLGDRLGLLNAFDADGRPSSITDFNEATAVGNISVKYDGDGRKLKTVKPFYYYCNGTGGEVCSGSRPKHFILSSVLGQEVGDFGERDAGGMERNSKVIGNGNRIADRRMRFIGGSNAQEATFLQRADPSGVEIVDNVIHLSGPWDSSIWGDGNGTVDPFGAGVGYENPYPPEREPPSPEECEDDCECWPGDGDNPPGWECEMEGFDNQSDESTETGSIRGGTCYNERGLTVKCKEQGDVVTLEDKKTGKLYLGVYDANNGGFRVGDKFVPSNIDGVPDSYGMTWMRLNSVTGAPDANGQYYEVPTAFAGTPGWGDDDAFSGRRPEPEATPPPADPQPTPAPTDKGQPIWCNPEVIRQMKRAWSLTTNGNAKTEAGFNAVGRDPSKPTVSKAKTGNYHGFEKLEVPAYTIALFHVHPNKSSMYPSTRDNNSLRNDLGDEGIADLRGIDIFVIHRDGLTKYDYRTKKSSIVRKGMSWSKPC